MRRADSNAMERPLLKTLSLSGVVVALAFTATAALADDALSIKIENHKFTPTELHVPANKRVSVYVENADATPEEFERKKPAVVPHQARRGRGRWGAPRDRAAAPRSRAPTRSARRHR